LDTTSYIKFTKFTASVPPDADLYEVSATAHFYEGRLKSSWTGAVRRCYAERGGDCYAKL